MHIVCFYTFLKRIIELVMRKAILKHFTFSLIVHISTHVTETEVFSILSVNTVTEIIKHLSDLNYIVISQ